METCAFSYQQLLKMVRFSYFFILSFCFWSSDAWLRKTAYSSPATMEPLAFLFMQKYLATNVNVDWTQYQNRPAVKVSLSEAYQQGPMPVLSNAYVEIPMTHNFYEGIIDVDIAAERNAYQDEFSRGFAGVAFRKQSVDQYDLVYLRMTNGLSNNPLPPADRSGKAVQYVSPPKWTSEALKAQFPTNNKYEVGAKIGEKRWNHLQLVVRNNTVTASIDNAVVLDKVPLLGANERGPIAFWVDDATDAYFANLAIRYL